MWHKLNQFALCRGCLQVWSTSIEEDLCLVLVAFNFLSTLLSWDPSYLENLANPPKPLEPPTLSLDLNLTPLCIKKPVNVSTPCFDLLIFAYSLQARLIYALA